MSSGRNRDAGTVLPRDVPATRATILGVRIEELVDPDESTETIVGANRDPQFDHVLMFGLGGIFVQIFEDTSFRVAPVTGREARAMVSEIRAAPMLDINPLVVSPDGVAAVDLRLTVDREAVAPAE